MARQTAPRRRSVRAAWRGDGGGLKTRGWEEVVPRLANLVAAARAVRDTSPSRRHLQPEPQAAARPREDAKCQDATGTAGNCAAPVCAGQLALPVSDRGWGWRAGLYAGFCRDGALTSPNAL